MVFAYHIWLIAHFIYLIKNELLININEWLAETGDRLAAPNSLFAYSGSGLLHVPSWVFLALLIV